jgi:pyruvate,orthophosphate dikinase
MRAMILAARTRSARSTWRRCSSSSSSDMLELFRVMDGLPVTIRLLDPPLHEFLPHERRGYPALPSASDGPADIRQARNDLMEVNPMLGFRGCRLSVVYPEITKMQVRAIIGAALEARTQGLNPYPEIMIPLVINVREIRLIGDIIDRGSASCGEQGVSLRYKVGTMMETPRACLGADRLAPEVEFMSFGTNDLTQMTYGFSRDDAGASYRSTSTPSSSRRPLRVPGPACRRPAHAHGGGGFAQAKKGIKYGICGEHGGDPARSASATTSASTTSAAAPTASRGADRRGAGAGAGR